MKIGWVVKTRTRETKCIRNYFVDSILVEFSVVETNQMHYLCLLLLPDDAVRARKLRKWIIWKQHQHIRNKHQPVEEFNAEMHMPCRWKFG